MDGRLALARTVAAGNRLPAALADDVGVATAATIHRTLEVGATAVFDENAVVVTACGDVTTAPLGAVAIALAPARAIAGKAAMCDSDIIHAVAGRTLQPAQRATSDADAAITGPRFANRAAAFEAAIAYFHDVASAPQIALDGADIASCPARLTIDRRAAIAFDFPSAVAELVDPNVVGAAISRDAQVSVGHRGANIARQKLTTFQVFEP